MSLVSFGGSLAGIASGSLLASIVPFGVTAVVLSMLAVFMIAMLILAVTPLLSENRSAQLGTVSSEDRATIETNEAD
ncbi:hypothetical protein [Natronococcus occultus]|uniref:Uncharacterized protein n=1 Tax=Natronococcus occultus SP4 TaxID=694430 RepID=L0JW80_9EURY|nr:hypothetical protein [Natronococcus occultus]AGB36344.1 hypothetical protein Natoc_0481 [Natronococcus occultus SP4]